MFDTISKFTYEELLMLNNFTSENSETQQTMLINRILVALAGTSSEELAEALKDMYTKVKEMNAEEYEDFISQTPFDVPLSEPNEEEQEYEEYEDWNEQDVEEFTEMILELDKAMNSEENDNAETGTATN